MRLLIYTSLLSMSQRTALLKERTATMSEGIATPLLEPSLLHSLSYLPSLRHLISLFLYSSPPDIDDRRFNRYWLEWNVMASSFAQSWSSKSLDRPSIPYSDCDVGKDDDQSKSGEGGNDDNHTPG